MPSPNPTVRRQHSGNAVTTTLAAPIVNGTDTSFTLTSFSGWPDGSVGNFVVTINAGQSDVEKILCSTRVGATVNVASRGFDSTVAAGHATTATASHTISALEIDEVNQHTNATAGVHGVTGSVVGTSDSQTLTNKTLTAPVIATISNTGTVTLPSATDTLVGRATTDTLTNKTLTSPVLTTPAITSPAFAGTATGLSATGATLDAASTLGGVSGTAVAADHAAWVAFTPTVKDGGVTPISITVTVARYIQIGKTVIAHCEVTCNAGTTSGAFVSLPVAGKARNFVVGSLGVYGGTPPANQSGQATMSDGSANSLVPTSYASVFLDVNSGQLLRYNVVYEAA